MKFQIDRRIGNNPRYVYGKVTEPLMLVPEEMKKCVVFLLAGRKGGAKIKVRGTAFMIKRSPSGELEPSFHYLVTARHVIDAIRLDPKGDGIVYIRVNTPEGYEILETSPEDWMPHPSDPSADIAILEVSSEMLDGLDVLAFPASGMANRAVMERQGFGCGEEVFVIGLFAPHSGRQKNLPIIRVGNIASTPEERINTGEGDSEIYLIEARSIGGLSGSPVFIHASLMRRKNGRFRLVEVDDSDVFFLLGVHQGHFTLSERELAVSDANTDDGNDSINIGIGAVVPVDKIEDILSQEWIMDREEKALKEHAKKKSGFVADSAGASEATITQSEFEKALRKASRKPEKPESEA